MWPSPVSSACPENERGGREADRGRTAGGGKEGRREKMKAGAGNEKEVCEGDKGSGDDTVDVFIYL